MTFFTTTEEDRGAERGNVESLNATFLSRGVPKGRIRRVIVGASRRKGAVAVPGQ